MTDYGDCAREISEGSEEFREGRLHGICVQLEACENDKDNENGPHILIVKETEFVATIVSLACNPDAVGKTAIRVLSHLANPEMNRLPLLQFPGLLDALVATPHGHALIALTRLSEVKDEAQRVAMATNTALVDWLVANVGRDNNACAALGWLSSSDNNRALLSAFTDATRVSGNAYKAGGVLNHMACFEVPMLRNPQVLVALLRAAGSGIDEVSDRVIGCLNNLSLESKNRKFMRDDVRIIDALTARIDYRGSKRVIRRICWIGMFEDLPSTSQHTLDLSLFCSRPFRHQLPLVKALIREDPTQLFVKDASGRTQMTLAKAAHLPPAIIGLLSDCVAASALDFSITHIVGYTRSGFALARAQRLALMCSLERATDRTALPAEEDEPGALNPGKALKAYLKGARTPRLRGYLGGTNPWSIIGRFAF
jgi:hypothetical protein